MSMRQFANSLAIIQRCEHTNRTAAICRHLLWQARKLAFPRPVQRRLSRSVITDDEAGGVISMVNMLGIYDYNNMNFSQTVLGKAGVFVDVGANIGAYTLIASEAQATRVISLEPNPTAYRKLRRNIALNGRQNVQAFNLGASSAPGVLKMTNNGAAVTNRIVDSDLAGPATIEVEVNTLDALCARLGVSPTLIKIDVEGHELEVLRGAATILDEALACIVENGDRQSVIDIMRTHAMEGPFYFRHRAGSLQRSPQALREDQIFIGRDFHRACPSIHVAP